MIKLLIIDRDGTLNRARDDFVTSPDEWEPLPGALEAVARLNQAGWRVVLATNQSALGRGLMEMSALHAIHTRMHQQLAKVGGRIDAVFFCPHLPEDRCDCRKPGLGLFEQIGHRFGVNLGQTHAAGNAIRHVQAAARAGCRVHLLLTGKSQTMEPQWSESATETNPQTMLDLPKGTLIHPNLLHFAQWLLLQPQTLPLDTLTPTNPKAKKLPS